MRISNSSVKTAGMCGTDMKPCPIIIGTGMGDYECPIVVGANNCSHTPFDWDAWERQQDRWTETLQRWETRRHGPRIWGAPIDSIDWIWPPGTLHEVH